MLGEDFPDGVRQHIGVEFALQEDRTVSFRPGNLRILDLIPATHGRRERHKDIRYTES